MALELLKLFVAVTTTTTTTTVPTDTRFFYITTADTAPGATLTIGAADFRDDAGTVGVTLPALAADNSYFNVYVDGVLQMEDLSTYTEGADPAGSLAIDVPATSLAIPTGTPVVLEVMNYAPVSDSTSTVTT